MAARDEKVLPQYSDHKLSFDEPDATLTTLKASSKKRRRFISFVVGAILLYVALKVFGHHSSAHADWTRPHRIPPKLAERIFLSVPNIESALKTSRNYATHPHLAGSVEDFEDARTMLSLFQNEFHIPPPHQEPLFPAGSKESREATLKLTSKHAPRRPTAWIDVYYPVLNTGLNHSLSILNKDSGIVEWEADLNEDGDPRDAEASKYRTAVPTWHGLSSDGDVTGQLVYANYGSQEDYEELVAAGVDFTGKIVLVRYGGIFRGLKIKGAQELGASGVLIYSDPRDDGYVTVANGFAAYPAGPARNPTSVQRGSVQFLSAYPGDPTTPGYPAYEDAERTNGTNIPSIPSIPISWSNAQRLFEEIGDLYIENEAGNKKLSGNISLNNVRLVNHVNTKVTPIWNTMAAIPGHIKNEVVVIGCHRDAWVMGAADPTSGTVSLHEVIKGLGALLRRGWTPLRTIVFASWDAEEYGLIGSTEWGEDFADWISDNVVAYLNVDVSVSGSRWSAKGSPSLAHFIKDVALAVDHPNHPGKKLWDAREDDGPFKSYNLTIDDDFLKMHAKAEAMRKASKTGVSPLGSGSDYTVFIQRLGVAAVDQGFGTTDTDAPYHYHSIYDSQFWQEVYADPGFYRHVAVAKHIGLMGLRFSDALLLPLNTTQYALELSDYLDRVESLASTNLAETPDFTALRSSIANVQAASAKLDVEKKEAVENFKKILRHLPPYPSSFLLDNYRPHCQMSSYTIPIRDWVKGVFGVPPTSVTAASYNITKVFGEDSWERVLTYAYEDDDTLPPWLPGPIRRFIEAARRLGRSNKKLKSFERGFISEDGIKDREWYKHLGVAPGKWLGYGATTLPALTEAITIEKNVRLAEYEAGRLTKLFNKLADEITPV